jgi:hypothetical protein
LTIAEVQRIQLDLEKQIPEEKKCEDGLTSDQQRVDGLNKDKKRVLESIKKVGQQLSHNSTETNARRVGTAVIGVHAT